MYKALRVTKFRDCTDEYEGTRSLYVRGQKRNQVVLQFLTGLFSRRLVLTGHVYACSLCFKGSDIPLAVSIPDARMIVEEFNISEYIS